MEAVVMRRKEVVQLLIEAGADLDLCNAVVNINNDFEYQYFIIMVIIIWHLQNGETVLNLGNIEIEDIIEVLSKLINYSFNTINLQKYLFPTELQTKRERER